MKLLSSAVLYGPGVVRTSSECYGAVVMAGEPCRLDSVDERATATIGQLLLANRLRSVSIREMMVRIKY